jgi:two-component sensor histidine kinase
MLSFRVLAKLLTAWLLLLLSGRSAAEAIRPRLSPAAYQHLLTQLGRSPADTARVRLLLLLSQDLLYQHDAQGTDFSPAWEYSREAAALSQRLQFTPGRIESCYVLGQLHTYQGEDTLGLGLIRQGIALSQRAEQPQLEAFGWYYLADSYGASPPELAAKRAYLHRAEKLFHQVGDQADEAYVRKWQADVLLQQGHAEQAIRELREVARLYRAAGHRSLHYTYDLLHAAYRQLGDYREALRYGLAALRSAQATQDTSIVGGLYTRLAAAHRELKQYPEALGYYRKALAVFQHEHNDVNAVTMAGAMARIMVAQHRPAEGLAFFTRAMQPYVHGSPRVTERIADYLVELHSVLGHFDQAERYAGQLKAYLNGGTADKREKTSICQTLGKFYVLTRRYDEARSYLQQALALNRHDGPLTSAATMHLLLFRADSAQARYPAAIAHYQRYKQLTDSVFNERKSQQLASLQMQYDTRRKEQSIALLTKQTQMQQARLRQREWQRNALLVGAGLLVGLLGLGYNRYRLKQRSNRLLEAQQTEINRQNQALARVLGEKDQLLADREQLLTEKDGLLVEKEWMLKEIHHRVKNNLQIVSSLLATQADYLADVPAAAAMRESQNRVQAMALIHQRLYQADNLSRVPMRAYLRDIVESLCDSFDCHDVVQVVVEVDDSSLDVALVTPLGLIVNEAVTNALKYAFPAGRRGTVRVAVGQPEPGHYQLVVADDGVGLSPDHNLPQRRSLGLTMIRGLSRQLGGTLQLSGEAGVCLQLAFATEVPVGVLP